MRVAFTGVSHGHLPLHLDPVPATRGVVVAGAADPHPPAAERAAAQSAAMDLVDSAYRIAPLPAGQ